MAAMIASVAVERAAYSYDKLYDYLIPEELHVCAGMRVVVPFGHGGDRMGFVLQTRSETPQTALKQISAVSDTEPLLDAPMLTLLRWLKEATFCTWFDALRAALPAGLGQRLNTCYTATGSEPNRPLSAREQSLLALLQKKRKPAAASALEQSFPDAAMLLESLCEAGAATAEQLVLRRAGDRTVTMVALLDGWQDCLLTPKQQAAAEMLSQMGESSVKELCYYAGVGKQVVDNLVAAGAAAYYEHESLRNPFADTPQADPGGLPPLTAEQQSAAESLWRRYCEKPGSTALLFGITGSGKTQVFLELVRRVAEQGRQAIVLVPEISLTPQTIEKFHCSFGKRVAVLHSSLSVTERLDEWKRIKSGAVDVVVGTRSAVFAPVRKLGLVVIDEEQEHTYRSENSPRYDAREAAQLRIRLSGGLLLLASATPSVESYYRAAVSGEYALAELSERYGAARLPDVTILDMRSSISAAEGLSEQLCEEMLYNLEHGEQTILLMNRRGHSTQVKCMSCHKPAECPNCSIALKFHAANNRLMCHYCGYSEPVQQACSSCGSSYIRYSGLGTQKIEEELHARFPQARVLRMDADTTMQKLSYQQKLGEFSQGGYDIMVGTQMVAKGLNFPNVTLVGVLGIDQSLYSDDFRSYEKTFSLITQVVGRSGRSLKPGRAFIQTYTPENPIILAAAQQQYKSFFHDEIASRKLALYPPFCRLFCVGISSAVETEAAEAAEAVMGGLERLLREKYSDIPVRLLGLSTESVYKVAGRFRYRILVKVKQSPRTRQLFAELLRWCHSGLPQGVSVFVNPNF